MVFRSTQRTFLFYLSICLIFFAVGCQSSTQAADGFSAKVEEYMQAHVKLKQFNGSILIAKDGKVLISKGYGMANFEHVVPNKPQTKFRLGSITKQFTATAIMQLQEKGLLNVNDQVKKYLPDYPNGDKFTIHHLLTHTSGVTSFTGFPEYEEMMVNHLSPEEIIATFKDKPLEFAPGSQYKYSNSGYFLLGYLVEKISGKPYDEYLQENIFGPLGMKDSGYDHNHLVQMNRATGYALDKGELVNSSYIDMNIPHGAGALFSTVEDLYKWDRALCSEQILSKVSLEKMFTTFKSNYGYGWSINQQFGHKRISHGGGINGFVTNISRFTEDDSLIVVLSNLENSHMRKINRDLAAILFEEPYELPEEKKVAQIDNNIYDLYVGTYQLEPKIFLSVTNEDNHLFVEATGQGTIEVFPESETRFFSKSIDVEITFVKDEEGKVTELILHQGGEEVHAKKIK